MKRFQDETNSNEINCSRELLDTLPMVVRTVRSVVRRRSDIGLTVPEFRTLGFLVHFPDSALAPVAEHLGLTPPTASKLIDSLVERGLVTRESAEDDRRRLVLKVTPAGRKTFQTIRNETEREIGAQLQGLSETEQADVCRLLRRVREVLSRKAETARPE